MPGAGGCPILSRWLRTLECHCHYVAIHVPSADIHSIRVNIKIEVDNGSDLICRTPALTVKVVELKTWIRNNVVLAGSGTVEVNIQWGDRGLKSVNYSAYCEHSSNRHSETYWASISLVRPFSFSNITCNLKVKSIEQGLLWPCTTGFKYSSTITRTVLNPPAGQV